MLAPLRQPMRIACIGLGWVTLHRHIPTILRNPTLQLIGVIDRHAGHAEKIAKQLNLPFFAETDNLRDVAWLDQTDALTIGTAPLAHAELAISAMSLGKHVLCEKPFAMNVAEGEAICAASQQHQRTLAVMHNFQFSRAANKLRRDLAAQNLGEIRRIAAVQLGNPRRRLPAWFEQLPLGLFYDESPHFFYLLHWLGGGLAQGQLKLQHAHALAPQGHLQTPTAISLLYRNQANLPLTIDCQFDSALSEWYVMVTGEKYLAILDIFRDIYIRLPNDNSHALPNILRTSASGIAQHLWQHIPNGIAYLSGRLDYGNDEVYNRFTNAMLAGNLNPPAIGGGEALAVLRLQHEAINTLQHNMLR